ncbi:PQQ-binding-like beta-propeller repeat protein [Streptomyces sp. NPDC059639]|uniref:outer membrane protein assembly factor BamB family protein n=1 Tax=Streptomyces sp. NPDC059639 TaxID=3346891 RepID=UPI003690A9CB
MTQPPDPRPSGSTSAPQDAPQDGPPRPPQDDLFRKRPPAAPSAPPSPGAFGPPPPPQASAQGYGYPGPPAAGPRQYPYTYPQPPTTPPPPPAGAGRPGAPVAWIIAAAVVAIALIIGAGVLYATSDGGGSGDSPGSTAADGKRGGDASGPGSGSGFGEAGEEKAPADPSARLAFTLPAPKVAKNRVDSVVGSWLTDRTYAKAGVAEIVGHDPATGKKTWTLPLPGQTCGATEDVTKDALAAVVSENGARGADGRHRTCSQITLFDVNTGDKVWTKSVGTGVSAVPFEEPVFSGDTLALGGGLRGGAALDIKTGRILWQPQSGTCEDVGYAGGAQLATVRKCGVNGQNQYEVQLLDPRTGRPKWTYKLANGVGSARVLSTDPVVVGVATGENAAATVTGIIPMSPTGKPLTTISLDADTYDLGCDVGRTDGCRKIVVGNGRVYLATRQHEGGASGTTNEIVSYGLTSGRLTGERVDGGDYRIFPLRMDGGNVLAYEDGSFGKGVRIVSIDPRLMKQTALLRTPTDGTAMYAVSGMVVGLSGSEVRYSGGRLFLGKALISAPASKDHKEYTAIAFTAGGSTP